MTPEILGPEWFPRNEEQRRTLFESSVQGTLHSNWPLLVESSRSLFSHTLVHAERHLKMWRDREASGEHPGETYQVLLLEYSLHLSGPLVGGILVTFSAIEALARLVAETALALQDLDEEVLLQQLDEYDRQSFKDRLSDAIALSKARELEESLSEAIGAFNNFRNDLVHEKPHRHDDLETTTVVERGGHRKEQSKGRYRGLFPNLHRDRTALGPTDLFRAVELHDQVLNHVMDDGSSGFLEAFTKSVQPHGIKALLPRATETVLSEWREAYQPWREALSPEEREEGYRRVVRRMVVRPVD